MTSTTQHALPIPDFFDPSMMEAVRRVPYAERATQGRVWAAQHSITPAHHDTRRIALVLIDTLNTFCLPDFELFVGGRSGRGAIDDNVRLGRFIYENLAQLSKIIAVRDTHPAFAIFHPLFFVNAAGASPTPGTLISAQDIIDGTWIANPALPPFTVNGNVVDLQDHVRHYTHTLARDGRHPLTIWPYHAMRLGIGHALVSGLEEACFFHSVARMVETADHLKGDHPLTENYSAFQHEVRTLADGTPLGIDDTAMMQTLLEYDAVIIAGQAKSHCVGETLQSLLGIIRTTDATLARKVYILEDCMSSVVIPEVIDFTDQADATFAGFADAGMHLVRSTDPTADWPGFPS